MAIVDMKEKYIFSAGYPIGFSPKDDVEYYNIQLNDKLYPVNLLSAFVWMEALKGGQTKLEIMDNVLGELQLKGYEIGRDFKLEDLEFVYESLLSASLLLEIDKDDAEKFIENYSNLKLVRTGFGIGIDYDTITIHNDAKDIYLDSLEYYIWQLSSESRTLKESYTEYYNSVSMSIEQLGGNIALKQNDLGKLFVSSFISLYKKNLIYIVAT